MRFTKLTTTAGTPGAAGLDLYADEDVLVLDGSSKMLGTGIADFLVYSRGQCIGLLMESLGCLEREAVVALKHGQDRRVAH